MQHRWQVTVISDPSRPASVTRLPFDLQGHRGARGLFPENTMEGFRAARVVGVDTFELDVSFSVDGIVMVHHDLSLNPDLARGPDGNWLTAPTPAIRSMTAKELEQFDVGRLRPGSAYAERWPLQTPSDGARIPRLSDVLRLDATVRFNIELKTDPRLPAADLDPVRLAEKVVTDVVAAGVLDRVTIESFDWRSLHHLRATRPDIALAWLTSPETVRNAAAWWGGARMEPEASVPRVIAGQGGKIWAPSFEDLTQAQIDEAHHCGIRVLPWTVNEPSDMQHLIEWGVDGLITDRPDLAHPVMRQAGLSVSLTGH
jgi:glycerophosphoryl diester phosphodiesterase